MAKLRRTLSGHVTAVLNEDGEAEAGGAVSLINSKVAEAIADAESALPLSEIIPDTECPVMTLSGTDADDLVTVTITPKGCTSDARCSPTTQAAVMTIVVNIPAEADDGSIDIGDLLGAIDPAYAVGGPPEWNEADWLAVALPLCPTTANYDSTETFPVLHKIYDTGLSGEVGSVVGSSLPSDAKIGCRLVVYDTYIIVEIYGYAFMMGSPAYGSRYNVDGNLLDDASAVSGTFDTGYSDATDFWPGTATFAFEIVADPAEFDDELEFTADGDTYTLGSGEFFTGGGSYSLTFTTFAAFQPFRVIPKGNQSMLFKNTASQKLRVRAWDATTGLPLEGDAANISGEVSIDYATAAAITDTHPTEVGNGWYDFDLTQAETNGNHLSFNVESATTDVVVIPAADSVITLPPAFPTLAIANNAAAANITRVLGTAITNINEFKADVSGLSTTAAKVDSAMELNSGNYRFTTAALANGPTGTATDVSAIEAVTEKLDTMLAADDTNWKFTAAALQETPGADTATAYTPKLGYNLLTTAGYKFQMRVQLMDSTGQVVDVEELDATATATVTLRELEGEALLFTKNFTAADFYAGGFDGHEDEPGFTSDRAYAAHIEVTADGNTYSAETTINCFG